MDLCAQCNAVLPADAERCPYCQLTTPLAVERQRAVEQAERDAGARAEAQATGALQRSARQAFGWSLAGFLFWCLGFPSVVGLILGVRARRRAVAEGRVPPGFAVAAVALGAVGCALFALFVVIGVRQTQLDQERQAALASIVAARRAAPILDTFTACALVELRLRERGLDGKPRQRTPDCPVAVTQQGDTAVLAGITVAPSGTVPPLELTGCLRRDAGLWQVVELKTSGTCP